MGIEIGDREMRSGWQRGVSDECRYPQFVGSSPDFKIIEETADYAIVDKPALLLTHPTKPDGPRTLWQGLRELFAFEIANGGQVSIVNRLDRETSGLILVAKTSASARRFGMLMQE